MDCLRKPFTIRLIGLSNSIPDPASESFRRDGYVLARGLFSAREVERYLDHYMEMRAEGPHPGDFSGVDADDVDPLTRFPRMIHMHRWDEVSLDWMIDPRIAHWLEALTGQPAYAVQTMLYFKPAGARGQALHQDQSYLRAKPGTCVAAWMALDRCDVENGCLQVVPESGDLPVLCAEGADTKESFTDTTVPLHETMKPVPVLMDPGDVLFFNGSVIHGSFPNRSERFRRALIGHYLMGDVTSVASFYKPVLDMEGREVVVADSAGGGPCGVWADAPSPVVTFEGR
tara:strand:+ start:3681 stop:4538 length:858 start_codon:yes stop_codon:yes gene_type:complete